MNKQRRQCRATHTCIDDVLNTTKFTVSCKLKCLDKLAGLLFGNAKCVIGITVVNVFQIIKQSFSPIVIVLLLYYLAYYKRIYSGGGNVRSEQSRSAAKRRK